MSRGRRQQVVGRRRFSGLVARSRFAFAVVKVDADLRSSRHVDAWGGRVDACAVTGLQPGERRRLSDRWDYMFSRRKVASSRWLLKCLRSARSKTSPGET